MRILGEKAIGLLPYREGWLLPFLMLFLVGTSELYAQDGGEKEGSFDVVMARSALPTFVPGEIIVKMKAGAAAALSLGEREQLGLESTSRRTSGGEMVYKFVPQEMARMETLSAQESQDQTLAIVKELEANPNVEYAQPNWILQPLKSPDDPLYAKQWHYFNQGTGAEESPGGINLPAAWEKTTGGDVVVAVIDTGILPDHSDIAGSPNLIQGYDFIGDEFRANDGDGRDDDPTDPGDAMKRGECWPLPPTPPEDTLPSWHGTHVAGTVGVGKSNNGVGIAGINWKVKVQALRVLGKCGGSSEDINDAIRWAAGLPVPGVPDNPTPAKVINMSLGGPQPCSQSPATQQAINDAVAQGTTVVVAAGNDGEDAAGFQPASCDNVITVAASGPNGALTRDPLGNDRFYYSNWGEMVEIMAPGGNHKPGCTEPEGGVLSAVKTASDRGNCGVPDAYAFYNGTSMAAPHVAGAAALLLSVEPNLTPAQVSARIEENAIPRDSSQCPKPCGAGLLNANFWEEDGEGELKISLKLDPEKGPQEMYQFDETIQAIATVKQGEVPLAETTVRFSSDNPPVAFVNPSSAVTDAQGQAKTQVQTQQQAGEAVVSARTDSTTATQPVRVPAISPLGLMVLIVSIVLLGLWRRRAER